MKVALIAVSVVAVVALAASAVLAYLLVTETRQPSDSQALWCWQNAADVATAADLYQLNVQEEVADWNYFTGIVGRIGAWDSGLGDVVEAYTNARRAFIEWVADKGYVDQIDDNYRFVRVVDAVKGDDDVARACLGAWSAEFGRR